MSKSATTPAIRLRGVRHNNLKNFDLDLPVNKLIVVTGLSGSGKSSLAFDTLYAEGQRRYVETFSPYARQFFDRMDKPQVDSIQGIPPAIAIEQRNTVKSTRSTVGTMTEICDYMKSAWMHLSQLYCRKCEKPVRSDSPSQIWELLKKQPENQGKEVLLTFDVPLSEKLSLEESLELISRQGFQRLLIPPSQTGEKPQIVRLDEAASTLSGRKLGSLTIIQDRVRIDESSRTRLVDACEQAYHFGKGKLALVFLDDFSKRRFSCRMHCAECDLEYKDPTPALFSFNHPLGACPKCRGFGRVITIGYHLAIPDRSLTLAGGAVKPWQSGQSADCQKDLLNFCRKLKVPTDVPFEALPEKWQQWVVNGDPDYGKDSDHEWPKAWYGVKGYFRWLESKAYKMHVRVLLSRYRSYETCSDCAGQRFQPEALLYKVTGPDGLLLTLPDFYKLPIDKTLTLIGSLARERNRVARKSDPLKLVLDEVQSRLGFLNEVGLGYLTLDRPTRSLSGGETERVNLTTCLGSRLVNTLFVLDEPSVGLHSRDTDRLVQILERLRNAGNSVVVVEHEASVMKAADQIVDLGPGHGESGGSVVFQGSYENILKSSESLTGLYLSGRKRIETSGRRVIGPEHPRVVLSNASAHNLKQLTAQIPLGRFVCVTGVSGSGKTTLVREVLVPKLEQALTSKGTRSAEDAENSDESDESITSGDAFSASLESRLTGWESIGQVVLVDQSPLGKTPRSNPAVYVGAFDYIRDLFAQSEQALQLGLNASAFSFNSSQGQCELCRGAGFEKVEMQFLSDVYIRCPDCDGLRYRSHILQVKLTAPDASAHEFAHNGSGKSQKKAKISTAPQWSIGDFLQATVDEALDFLSRFNVAAARKAEKGLKLLQEVGLGYLRLGQPINTLSGGESQRLKLVSHLAALRDDKAGEGKPALFLFDEPTTGLHFQDVAVLLQVFHRLVDSGHSVLVIEHNLDVIKTADWVIDLGPEAGEQGGELVAEGTPETIAACKESYTGAALRPLLGNRKKMN